VLNINVTRALSGDTSIDHVDCRLVVAIHDGRAFRRKAEVSHDGAHVSSMLRCGNSGKEFRFGGAGSGDGLRLTSVGDSVATQEEGIASSRSAVAQIVGVGALHHRRLGLDQNWIRQGEGIGCIMDNRQTHSATRT